MQSTIEKMTPSWFIVSLNENFKRLNDLANGVASLIILTTAMTSIELKSAYDDNINAINAVSGISLASLTIGINGGGIRLI